MNTSELTFSDAWILWVAAPLFVLWAVFLLRHIGGGRAASAVRYSAVARLRALPASRSLRLRQLVQATRLLTVAFLLVAMTRPQTGRKLTEVSTEGVDIMLVVDTSGSMQARDLDPDKSIPSRRTRLEVVKSVLLEFVQRRPNDQIGLVVFGSEAFTQCPLTLDHGIVASFIERLEIGMAGDATALGSGLGTAVKRLQDSKAKSRVVILLTDGLNNAGSLAPKTAGEVAQSLGVRVYTVGAGTRGKAPFLVQGGLFGDQVRYEDVQIDEDLMTKIADGTGGAYFRAEDAEALRNIYAKIDALERTEIKSKAHMEYDERFAWFVLPALVLLLGEVLLLGTRLRKLP